MIALLCFFLTLFASLSFPKIPSVRIGAIEADRRSAKTCVT